MSGFLNALKPVPRLEFLDEEPAPPFKLGLHELFIFFHDHLIFLNTEFIELM